MCYTRQSHEARPSESFSTCRVVRVSDHRAPDFQRLAGDIAGQIILPEDADYEVARRVWNGMIDKRPLAIVRCANAGDVLATIPFATDNGIENIAVRGGGHNIAGNATCDKGLVIDLSPMRDLVRIASRMGYSYICLGVHIGPRASRPRRPEQRPGPASRLIANDAVRARSFNKFKSGMGPFTKGSSARGQGGGQRAHFSMSDIRRTASSSLRPDLEVSDSQVSKSRAWASAAVRSRCDPLSLNPSARRSAIIAMNPL